MTYAATIQSNDDGRQVSLYRFTWGNSVWRYTSADRELTFDALPWEPQPIREGALEQGGNRAPEFQLTVPLSLPVVALFRGTPPSTKVTVEAMSFHPDDPDLELVHRWIGPVSNVQPQSGGATATIVSRVIGLRRGGLRLTYGRGCKYALFGAGCGVDKTGFAHARTVTAVDGNSITLEAPSPSADYFNGGFLEWDADGNGTPERRTIERETGSGVYALYGRADGISPGLAVTLYPGCRRNTDDCSGKFANLANYPGLDFMRGETPFEGRALI